VVGVDSEVEFSAMSEPRQESATDLNAPGYSERWLSRKILTDALMTETVQYEMLELMATGVRRKIPTIAQTAGMGHPTSKAQLQRRNFNGEENRSPAKRGMLNQ
jgi:hypothetical protein